MANQSADIELLFGVFGGDGFGAGSSGKLIQDQLTEIVKQINAKPFEIKFKADETSLNGITEKIKKSIGTVTVNTNPAGTSDRQDQRLLKSVTAYNNALSKLESIRHTIESGKDTLFTTKDSEAVEKYTGDLEVLEDMMTELRKSVDSGISRGKFEKEFSAISLLAKETSNHIKELTADIKNASASVSVPLLGDNQTVLNNSMAKIESLWHNANGSKAVLAGLGDSEDVKKFTAQIGSIKGQLEALRTTAGTKTKQEFDELFSSISLEAKKASNGINEYAKSVKNSSSAESNAAAEAERLRTANQNVAQSIKNITDARNKYAAVSVKAGSSAEMAALDKYEHELNNLIKDLNAGAISQDQFNKSLTRINGGVSDATRSLAAYESQTISLKDRISDVTKELVGFYSARTLIMRGASAIKDMVNNAIELESAFADTRIVTHATTEELRQFGVNITAIANETATAIEDLVSATTTFARLGFSLEESTMLAKFTGMLEKVGNVDTERAENAITSILKAFPNEVNVRTIESAMDKLVKTGNNFPISVDQIAEGMTNASSALAAAGNSFEQSVALLTAANTTVQNASRSSTALRTIAARIRKTDSELEDLGEVMTVAKYEDLINALTKHNVQLTDVNNEFRSTYDILKDIAAHWHEMSSMEQAAVAETISGTRQQVVFYSIIDQFQEATNAMDAMANSAGTLEDSYSIYLDTAAAHIERLGIAWKTFSMDAVDSNFIKTVVDIGTGVLNVADALQRVHMLIPTIVTGITAIKALKMSSELKQSAEAVSFVVSSFRGQATVTESLKAQFLSLNAVQQQTVLSQLSLAKSSGDVGAAQALAAIKASGLAEAETEATVATTAFDVSLKKMLASNPVLWIGAAIAGIIALIGVIKSLKEKNEEAARSIEDINSELESMANTANQAVSKFRDLKAKADEIIPRFVELSDGVDRFGQKTEDMTDAEYAEFVSLTNQVAEMFPELVVGMDDAGNAMLDLNMTAKDLSATLWDMVDARRELSRLEVANQMGSAVNDAYESNKIYKEREDRIRSAIIALKELKSQFRYDEYFGSEAISQLAPITGFENLADALDVIRDVSPEFNDILDKLEGVDAAGLYYILGEGYDIASFDKDIDNIISHTQSRLKMAQMQTDNNIAWNYVKQTATAWVQSLQDYQDTSGALQNVISSMINNIDYSKLNLDPKNGEEFQDVLQKYLFQSVVDPVLNMSTAGQQALEQFMSISNSFVSGRVSVSSMADAIRSLNDELVKSGVSSEQIEHIFEVIGATDLSDRIDTVRDSITGEADAVEKFINSLTSDDLNVVYRLVTEEDIVSVDELTEKLYELKNATDEVAESMSTSLDLTDFLSGLKDAASDIDTITSAMSKLQKGTALTTSEMIKLAEKFPEMLTESNMFTDGSIEGQRKMLTYMLESNKKEYEAQVDTKVAELKVAVEAIKAQVNLEKEKQKLRTTIYTKALAGQITQKTKWLREVVLLDALESQNFAEMKDGEVAVNEVALNKMSEGTNEILANTVNHVWNEYGKSVANVHGASAYAGLEAVGQYVQGTVDMLNALDEQTRRSYESGAMGGAGANVLRNLFGNKIEAPNIFYTNGILSQEGSYYSLLNGSYGGTSYYGSVNKLTNGYGSVRDWYNANSKNTLEIIREWEGLINSYENEISNLEALKNFINVDLENTVDEIAKSVGGGSSSNNGGGSSSNSDPIASWYRASKHYIETKTNAPHFDYVQFIVELSQKVNEAINSGQMAKEDAFKYLEEIAKAVDGFKTDMEKAIDDLVQYRIKAIKSAKEEEKKALNEELSALKKAYDEQKNLLRKSREEEKYIDEQAEKREAVSSLKSQISMLKYDNSAWAQSKIAELEKDLKDAEKTLADFERDREIDLAEDFLDEQYAEQEKLVNARIEEIDNFLKDPTSLYNLALSEISSNSEAIYEELKEYGRKNGDGKNNEAVDLWNAAAKAIEAYEKYINVSNGSYYIPGTYTTDPENWIFRNGIRLTGYASGTKYASAGLHKVNERGNEMIFESASGTKYKLFSGGEMVLDASASKFLYQFASTAGRNIGMISTPSSKYDIAERNVGIGTIQTGNIIINGNVNEATVSEIRRAQRDQLETIVKEIGKLR